MDYLGLTKKKNRRYLLLAIIVWGTALLFSIIVAKAFSADVAERPATVIVRPVFPQAGGCYVFFGHGKSNWTPLEEEELPDGFSELGVREKYHNRFFSVSEFPGSFPELQTDDPVLQELLEALEGVD